MKSLKKIVFSVLSEDIFGQVMNGQKAKEKYVKALLTYNEFNQSKKKEVISRLLKKIQRKSTVQEKLGSLHFCQYLICSGHPIILPFENVQDSVVEQTSKQAKHLVAQKKFINFYYEYLHNLLNRNRLINWKKCEVKVAIKQSKLLVQSIIDFLRIDFVSVFCLQHSKASDLFSLLILKILERVCQDLHNLNAFVSKWSYLILEKSEHDLQVNQIYEKLLFINKQFKKLEKFRNIMKIPIFFPKYTLNKEINTTIQKEVTVRINQKKKIQSEKRIRYSQMNANPVNFFAIDEQPASISIANEQSEFIPHQDQFI